MPNKMANSSNTIWKLRLECWDWEKDGKDQFIGEAYLDAYELRSNQMLPK